MIAKRNKEIELEAKQKNIQTKDKDIPSSCCCWFHIFSTKAEEERVNKEDGKKEQKQKLDNLLIEEIIKPVRQGKVEFNDAFSFKIIKVYVMTIKRTKCFQILTSILPISLALVMNIIFGALTT